MPYKSVDDLPPAVKDNLPKGAQEIYKNAYNFASKENPDWSAEDRAKYAWGAVKKAYENKDGKWVKKMGETVMNASLTTELPGITDGTLDVSNLENDTLTSDEFTMSMPEDDAGWARLFFHIPPEVWEELAEKRRSEYISQIPAKFAKPPVTKRLAGYVGNPEIPLKWSKVGNVLELEGTLIAEGVWTGMDGETVFYPRGIFPDAVDGIVGAQIKRGHYDSDNDVVGFVTAASAVDDKILIKGIIFAGDCIDAVAMGELGGISMEAEVHAEWSDEGNYWVATDMNLLKATLVEHPACEPCRVGNMCVVTLQKKEEDNKEKRKMSAELKLLENPLFKDVVATLNEAEVAETVIIKVLDVLRRAAKSQSNAEIEKQVEDLKASILTKDTEIDEKDKDIEKKQTEIEAKDAKIEELKTKNSQLQETIDARDKAEVSALLSQIKTLDKDFDEKDLLEGVECLTTQKTLLQKVLNSVSKLSKKTKISVDNTPEVETKLNTILSEMGIEDVKKFIEG